MADDQKKSKSSKKTIIPLENSMIGAIKAEDFIKNPLVYSQIRGDFTKHQAKIMNAIVTQVQDRINNYFSGGEFFTDAEVQNSEVSFKIPLVDLGIDPRQYNVLPATIYSLLHMDMVYKDLDNPQESRLVMQNIFSDISMPEKWVDKEESREATISGKAGRKYIQINMLMKAASRIFDLKHGYVEHIRTIFDMCSERSARLYIYLSAWKSRMTYTVDYLDLKEFFGLLKYSDVTRKTIEYDRYQKFGAFTRDVLKKAQRELKELADKGDIEFYFEYEPVYPGNRKRGNPSKIKFNLIRSDFGIARLEAKRIDKLQAALIEKFHISEVEWESIKEFMHESLVDDIYKLFPEIQAKCEKYPSSRAHVIATNHLVTWLMDNQPKDEYVEILETPEEESQEPALTPEQMIKWTKFCHLIKKADEKFYDVYVTPCMPTEVGERNICIGVPSKFVYEQWEENSQIVYPSLIQLFGKEAKLSYKIVRA